MERLTLHHGDCLSVLRNLPDCFVDSVVTDPPYGLSFMGKRWDYDVPSIEVWAECLRVLKPGGHLLAFAGTRTQHRMAVRIEDAGFEIRDMIAWVYGSGFPKSLDVSKAIDKAAGAEREVVATRKVTDSDIGQSSGWNALDTSSGVYNYTAPTTPEAKQWEGWGTALKPALEPITVARKPLIGTVAENVLHYGTGAINVDGARISRANDDISGWSQSGSKASENRSMSGGNYARTAKPDASGRWPANFIHDGSEEANELLGTSARFFYCAKASKADRDGGCEKLQERSAGECVDRVEGSAGMESPRAGAGRTSGSRNHHPTVKPTDLMRYLCRLVTPPSGIVLDPFMGSGSTGKAAMLEGFAFVGIEREAEYIDIAKARIQSAVGLL